LVCLIFLILILPSSINFIINLIISNFSVIDFDINNSGISYNTWSYPIQFPYICNILMLRFLNSLLLSLNPFINDDIQSF
jgi:hypothetical protein